MANSPVNNIPYIPDDLLLNCLARVSRLYYPILSLVSKRFRSLVSSLELYEIRMLLGHTENCLYLSLRLSSESDTRWLTLCRRPTRIPNPNPNPNFNSRWFSSCFRPDRILKNHTMKKEKKSSDNLMVSFQIPSLSSPSSELTGIAIGSNIYMMSIFSNGVFSSRFFFMDCRSHTLHEAPSMHRAPKKPSVNVLDGKIYVIEGCKNPDYSNLIECFDQKTLTWEHVPSPSSAIRGRYITASLVFDGKLYLFGDKKLVYKPNENKWDVVGLEMPLRWTPSYISCVVDNVIYCFGASRLLLWYNTEERTWRYLKGLKKLPKLPKDYTRVRLVNYGGKIAVLWEEDVRVGDPQKKMIWCAEITLERRNAHKIYGKIEWCDVVLTVPKSCSLLQFVAVTV
ncbi:putative F-box/kelch-repeat protein At4g11750 [Arabidopsis lyrata subsp. lyrata]|uniref:putative F-box/kelch-repeat protein At4g11750 n=1 Tax=Arabidopsis lyrata subsp. lyrata TaxID=81972 RepID=UPI000A29BE4D|nr:putative F-box/kelch-repeat protein At4g11750 [Arabidopsis lyrata subsp. lyrata]|eukprot:XP_020876070.1 putative F-box/kelch-repeat protein At4g11750 [Arabidopsis lyrata subsp. lyrata]